MITKLGKMKVPITLVVLGFIVVAASTVFLGEINTRSQMPQPYSASIQGRLGQTTLALGSFSFHPISAIITDQSPVCLMLIAVKIDGPIFDTSNKGIFLMGNQHTYPPASIHAIGQDAPFGLHKVRAYAFNPTELCEQGELKLEDLALMVVRPEGIGIMSFVSSNIQASK
jgi:hypothetical protein